MTTPGLGCVAAITAPRLTLFGLAERIPIASCYSSFVLVASMLRIWGSCAQNGGLARADSVPASAKAHIIR
jgi:hypothetical protein